MDFISIDKYKSIEEHIHTMCGQAHLLIFIALCISFFVFVWILLHQINSIKCKEPLPNHQPSIETGKEKECKRNRESELKI